MNILIGTVATDYMESWVTGLLDRLVVENCAVIFADEERMNIGRLTEVYATHKFLHADCHRAKYGFIKENLPPVDDSLLEKMRPFERIALWMLERVSGRSFAKHWRDYCRHIYVWNYLLDSLHIDVYLAFYIPHDGFDFIIYALCKIKGIRTVFSMYTHFLEYSYMVEDIFNQLPTLTVDIDRLKKQYGTSVGNTIPLSADMERYFRHYFEDADITPYYMKNVKSGFRPLTLRNAISHCAMQIFCSARRGKLILKSLLGIFSFTPNVYKYAEDRAYKTEIYREHITLINYYEKHACTADYSKKYIYVPLHMQPELTTSPLGGNFVDQLLMVKLLSYCLPAGYFLYIKEHPAQFPKYGERYVFRTLEFYEDLLQIPNVCFISMQEDTYKLIEGSCGVASVTGTAGLEAIVRGKLFFMFGFYLTQYAPNVISIRTLQDCYFAMKKMIKYRQDDNRNKQNIRIYFRALENHIFYGAPEDQPELREFFPNDYWADSRKNTIDAYCEKLVELMGKEILK